MAKATTEDFGPWSPGLTSTIPGRLLPRVSLFDPAHAELSWDAAKALSDGIGLSPVELAILKPERLALHSVLIRVTSQLSVPDGPNYADLGVNLRGMAAAILDGFVLPRMAELRAAHRAVRQEARAEIARLLDAHLYAPPAPPDNRRGLARWFSKPPPPPRVDPKAEALRLATDWAEIRYESVPAACKRALARTLGAALKHRALLPGREILEQVALGLVLARMGSAAVGRVVDDIFPGAVAALGYRMLPAQSQPVVLNAKGASASGKSSIRASQRAIAERLGLEWQDFAIISPDYWRKALIDYDGLGEDSKYAAMLCGQELEVIDRKLDIRMAVKGETGTVPHMLIDRFRFDSFARDRLRAEDSTLLTRFGAKIYLFFLITPPAETVERAWSRGQTTGRYKAVDDLLYHNIEAYSGMPDLFFSWATRQDRWVHYEFLDNDVPKGEPPRTVAFGQNGALVINDPKRFYNVERFAQVNVDAKGPAEVFTQSAEAADGAALLRRCQGELSEVYVLQSGSAQVASYCRNGKEMGEVRTFPDSLAADLIGQHSMA